MSESERGNDGEITVKNIKSCKEPNAQSSPDFSKISLKSLSRLLKKYPEKFPVKRVRYKKPDSGLRLPRPGESLRRQAPWLKTPAK